MSRRTIWVTVNGRAACGEVELRRSLADFLREDLDLTGTHLGCEHGVCGACTVLLGAEPVRSCLLFAVQADGAEVTTVEGLAPAGGALHPVQEAFWDRHALQCGFCTPGMLLTAVALLRRNPRPSEAEIRLELAGNLCMCTGYVNIIRAVQLAAERLAGTTSVGGPPTAVPQPRGESRKWVGQAMRRREDPRFLTGTATYIDDLKPSGMLHAAVLRSPHAHARIVAVDASAAAPLPGVHAVLTGEDVRRMSSPMKPIIPIPIEPQNYCLAVDRVRYVGEPVAAVAAVDRASAEDALDASP